MASSPKGPSKTKLVTDLDDAYKKLNLTLEKTKKLSTDIATNLQGLAPGGGNNGGGASSMSSANLPAFITPQDIMGYNNGVSSTGKNSMRGLLGSAAATMIGGTLTAATSAISSNDYILNSAMSSRFGFFAGKGNQENSNYASNKFQSMSNAGTPTSNLDAANAVSLGNSSGLMSGLKKYDTITNSAASISNIMPGTGLEGGMGAVASLNQGASVNKLRMIGINVRDQNGFMRDIEAIARDLWSNLTKTKSGKSKITTEQLSFSLQAGNSLDMMLNQYFGNDAVLRQAIISYLYQFAQEGGKALSYESEEGKAALLSTGADTSISQSAAKRQAAGYKVTNAYTGAGVEGIKNANSQITWLSNMFANNVNDVTQSGARAATYAETISGAGSGGGAAIVSSVLKSAGDMASALGPLAKLLGAVAGIGGVLAVSNFNADTFVNPSTGQSRGTNNPSGGGGSNGGGAGKTYTVDTMTFRKDKSATTSEITWAEALLKELQIAPNQNNVAALVAWKRKEGGGGKNNPLNSGFTVQGSTDFNDRGVQNYTSQAQGISATAQNLKKIKGVGYDKILEDLGNGSSENKILTDVANSGWSGTNYGGTMVHINLPNVTKLTDSELKKAVKEITDQISQNGQIRGL